MCENRRTAQKGVDQLAGHSRTNTRETLPQDGRCEPTPERCPLTASPTSHGTRVPGFSHTRYHDCKLSLAPVTSPYASLGSFSAGLAEIRRPNLNIGGTISWARRRAEPQCPSLFVS